MNRNDLDVHMSFSNDDSDQSRSNFYTIVVMADAVKPNEIKLPVEWTLINSRSIRCAQVRPTLRSACGAYINNPVRSPFDIQGHCNADEKLSHKQRELMQA